MTSPAPASLEECIHFNNAAASLMESHEYEQAIQLSVRALKTIKAWAALDERQLCHSSGARRFCQFSKRQTDPFYGSGDCDHPTIFAAPIVVHDHERQHEAPSSSSSCDSGDFHVLSYVFIYNLALGHHLKGMASAKRSAHHLQSAKLLYQSAHQILAQQQQTEMYASLSWLHPLALGNNLGHIAHVQRDGQLRHLCYQSLLSSVFCLVECGCNDDAVLLENFLSNALPILSPTTAAGAA